MPPTWTPAQEAAMNIRDRTLLVSAAAGSGKTATLTQRIIRSLTDVEHPVALSRILVVTFTRAAAAELKDRISGALARQLDEPNAPKEQLYRHILQLGAASISTIDAFCMELVRAHFADLGLPADFRMADEAELRPLCEEIMTRKVDEGYDRYAPEAASADHHHPFAALSENAFADLCDALTPSKQDEALIPTLLHLYRRLLLFPEGLSRLRQEAQLLEDAAASGTDFLRSPHGRILWDWMTCLCASANPFYDQAYRRLTQLEDGAKFSSIFHEDQDFFLRLSQALDRACYEEVRQTVLSYTPPRMSSARCSDPEIIAFKKRRACYIQELRQLSDVYLRPFDAEDATEQMRQTARMCRLLDELLQAFDNTLMAEKKLRGLCDFSDNRRFLLQLLQTPDGRPTPLADDYAAAFDQVYIDEYQDVDDVQDRIFSLIGGNHRFMVGDIKQSIYGFRGADPSVFARYRRELPDVLDRETNSSPHTGGRLFMSDNFRCDDPIIRVTNAVCGELFRCCPESIGYTAEDDLTHSKLTPETYTAPAVVVDVLLSPPRASAETTVDDEDDNTVASCEWSSMELESVHVANQVAKLLRTPTHLADGRIITPADIAILVRTRKSLSAMTAALEKMGVPTGCEELERLETGQNLLHSREMTYLMNLLRTLDNPEQDVPLSELLRAPFPGLTLDDLVMLRHPRLWSNAHTAEVSDMDSASLYQMLELYESLADDEEPLREKVRTFCQWLQNYRTRASAQSADQLLQSLGQDSRCGVRDGASFLYLYEKARTRCAGSTFVGLHDFLTYMEKLLLTETGPSFASDEAGDGHVTLMTIHNAKGLEYPVCFVVRCGQSFYSTAGRSDLLFHAASGASMRLYQRSEHRKIDTLLRRCAALAVKQEEREEEMRILYVAMTRAKERLYLCGCVSENQANPPQYPTSDRYGALSTSNYMSWILSALKKHPEIADCVACTTYAPTDIRPDAPLTQPSTDTESTPPSPSDRSDDPQICSAEARCSSGPDILESEAILRQIPTKIAASRMQELLLDRCVFLPPPNDAALSFVSGAESIVSDESVSQDHIREALRLMRAPQADENEFDALLRANQQPTAAERGTATHHFLQYCAYESMAGDRESCAARLREEIRRLQQEGFLSAREASMLRVAHLEAFFQSDFFAHMQQASRIRRELRFNRFVPLRTLTRRTALAEILGERTLHVQGSMDLVLEFPNGAIELCDYKTDAVTQEELHDPERLKAHLKERHMAQLEQYALAIADLYHRLPTQMYIFSLPLGQAIPMMDVSLREDTKEAQP